MFEKRIKSCVATVIQLAPMQENLGIKMMFKTTFVKKAIKLNLKTNTSLQPQSAIFKKNPERTVIPPARDRIFKGYIACPKLSPPRIWIKGSEKRKIKTALPIDKIKVQIKYFLQDFKNIFLSLIPEKNGNKV